MEFDELSILVKKSWCKETCDETLKNKWNENNPALGQSLVTALAVNEFLGGTIVLTSSKIGNHYYNVIDDKIIDFAYIGSTVPYKGKLAFSREYLLQDEETKEKYMIFLNNIKENMKKNNNKR